MKNRNRVSKLELEDLAQLVGVFAAEQNTRARGDRHAEHTRLLLRQWAPGVTAQAYDPTGIRVTSSAPDIDRDDPVDVWERQYAQAWQKLEDAIASIRKIDANVRSRGDQKTDGRFRQPADRAGHCLACGIWVDGTSESRLRSGFCFADYQRYRRAGHPDRAEFIRQRQAEVLDSTNV